MKPNYHPDNIHYDKHLLPMLNDSLLQKWYSDLSKFDLIANQYLHSSWTAFSEQLKQLPIIKAESNLRWFSLGEESHDDVDGKHQEMQSSQIKAILQTMLPIAKVLFHTPHYQKHPVTREAHQVIHDLFQLVPEERFGYWRISNCPVPLVPINPTRSGVFESLPLDVLSSIFGTVNLSYALRIRLVSKGWRDHVATRVHVKCTPKNSQNAENVLQHLLKIVPKLTKVNLCSVNDPITVQCLIGLLKGAPIKSLRLETVDDTIVGKLSGLSALRYLYISKPNSNQEFSSVCQAVPLFLEKLSLEFVPQVEAIPISLQRLKDLQKLNMSLSTTSSPREGRADRHQFSLAGLEMISKLTTLRLYLSDTLLSGVNHAFQSMNQLRELSLGFNNIINSDNRVQSPTLQFPSSLTSLACTFRSGHCCDANHYFSKLPSMKSLCTLTLSFCGEDLCEALAPIIASVSTLKRLELAIMMGCMKVLICCSTQIQQLCLTNCYLDAGFLSALSNLTRLCSLEIKESKFDTLKTFDLSKSKTLLPALHSLTLSKLTSTIKLSPLLNEFSHLRSLQLHSCVLDDGLVAPLQRMTLLDSFEMIDCTIDEENRRQSFLPVHLPVRYLRIDHDSTACVSCEWDIRFSQLEHLSVIGFQGCEAWDFQLACLISTCNAKNLQTIHCARCTLLCQHAFNKLSRRCPNAKVIYHQSIVTCEEDHENDQDDDDDAEEENEYFLINKHFPI